MQKRFGDGKKELNKTICLYYGVPGHGKGTVDAMSSWGAKNPTKKAILRDNHTFSSAEQIQEFLASLFDHDKLKRYYLVGKDSVKSARSEKKTCPIKGVLDKRMLSIWAGGSIQAKKHLCSCSSCAVGKLINCEIEPGTLVVKSDLIQVETAETKDTSRSQ